MENEKLDLIIQELREVKERQVTSDDRMVKMDAKLDHHTEQLNLHTEILDKHTEQLASHDSLLAKLDKDLGEVKSAVYRLEENGPKDIYAMLNHIDDQLKPIKGMSEKVDKMVGSLDDINLKLDTKDTEIVVLNNRLFKLETKVEQIMEQKNIDY